MTKNNEQQEVRDLSYLTLFSSFLGCMNYVENLKQTSNDDLMDELKKQHTKYFEKIIEQNDQILKLLTSLNGNKEV